MSREAIRGSRRIRLGGMNRAMRGTYRHCMHRSGVHRGRWNNRGTSGAMLSGS